MAGLTLLFLQGILFLCFFVSCCEAYKPVLYMHGIDDDQNRWKLVIQWVEEEHPGTIQYPLSLYDDIPGSWAPLWDQSYKLAAILQNVSIQPEYSNGYHLVCHSQGALICRAAIELSDSHKVANLILLTGPNMGEYGPNWWLSYLFPTVTIPLAWRILYTSLMQKTLSIANFWNDPYHHAEYLKEVIYLPVINNEVDHPDKDRFRKNFVQLKKLIAFGSQDDEVIYPWYSAHFEYLDQAGARVGLYNMTIYIQDLFGLRTLDKRGSLTVINVPNVYHVDWVTKRDIFVNNVVPHLD